MSCGHCQLKIKAELESNDYSIIKIDMEENSVLVDAQSSESRKLIKILDGINYVVDDQVPIVDIVEHTIWDEKLEKDSNYKLFSTYLSNDDIDVVGFNENDFGLIILCTELQYDNAKQYIDEM
jgi:copper chaperone CopZ